MHAIRNLALLLLLSFCQACGQVGPTTSAHETGQSKLAEKASVEASIIASLIDPVKLATLGERGANPRVRKVTGILWQAKQAGKDPRGIVEAAVRQIGWGDTEKGKLTVDAMLRNLDILEKLGSTTPDDIAALSRGKAPVVRKGPYTGDILSVDHIIPRAVCPELDNVIANLELMPLRMNQGKSNGIGQRQVNFGKKMMDAGMLSNKAFALVGNQPPL